jgi:hypothetical protein
MKARMKEIDSKKLTLEDLKEGECFRFYSDNNPGMKTTDGWISIDGDSFGASKYNRCNRIEVVRIELDMMETTAEEWVFVDRK